MLFMRLRRRLDLNLLHPYPHPLAVAGAELAFRGAYFASRQHLGVRAVRYADGTTRHEVRRQEKDGVVVHDVHGLPYDPGLVAYINQPDVLEGYTRAERAARIVKRAVLVSVASFALAGVACVWPSHDEHVSPPPATVSTEMPASLPPTPLAS